MVMQRIVRDFLAQNGIMRSPDACMLVSGYFLLYLFALPVTSGLSWGTLSRNAAQLRLPDKPNLQHGLNSQDSLSNMYASVLSELQELESEPLCHRNAARHLVTNCQLLNGKDEATLLTNTGRAARDFVDSYAASLAICDLERGSFAIPLSCTNFRETALAKLPISPTPKLHVSTAEIDKCLEGLAQSDSAWNTWVSYRHKALRFCDAARAENEKDHDIRLYQKITKILSTLTTTIETQMETKLSRMEQTFERTNSELENLGPRIDIVKAGLDQVEHVISDRLIQSLQDSQDLLNRGYLDAKNLQGLLYTMIEHVSISTEEVTEKQKNAVQLMTRQASDGVELIVATMTAASTAAELLQNDIAGSQLRVANIARQQEGIEMGMRQLEGFMAALSERNQQQGEMLSQAEGRAKELLGTLDTASASAQFLQNSLSKKLGNQGWWPFIYCPVASLFLGSYGLPPSIGRNAFLIAIGEVAGYLMSYTAKQMHTLVGFEANPTGSLTTSHNSTPFVARVSHSDSPAMVEDLGL